MQQVCLCAPHESDYFLLIFFSFSNIFTITVQLCREHADPLVALMLVLWPRGPSANAPLQSSVLRYDFERCGEATVPPCRTDLPRAELKGARVDGRVGGVALGVEAGEGDLGELLVRVRFEMQQHRAPGSSLQPRQQAVREVQGVGDAENHEAARQRVRPIEQAEAEEMHRDMCAGEGSIF